MRFSQLLTELRRRRVPRVVAAYAVAGFTVLEAADLVLPGLGAPGWIYRVVVLLVLAGFPVATVLAWAFDITPEGIRREGADAVDVDGEEPPGWKGRPIVAATVVVGLVGLGAWWAGRRSAYPEPGDPSKTLMVLPFVPAAPDSALERLGRELAITLSYTVEATAEIGTVDPMAVLAAVEPGTSTLPLERGRELARSLGAEHLLQGGLVETTEGVRLDVSLWETEGTRPLGTETASARGTEALTDSATLAVLRLVWEGDPAAPPSPGAISTGSPRALHAYLEGERAIAEGRWRQAPEAFARAVAADSSFWFAYWRLQYAREYHGEPVDSVVRARVWEHRDELPERDRLLVEADARPLPQRLRTLREATVRFPTYWPAWWALADLLVHHGGYMGHTRDEARGALERTVSLNPAFLPGWQHLVWVAALDRDEEGMRRTLAELSDARYGRVALEEAGINSLALYEALLALVEADGRVPARVVESGVEELAGYRGPVDAARIASGLAGYGFFAAQIATSRAILAAPEASGPMRRAQHRVLAHAWAARERWDSALAHADAWAASASRAEDLLLPYQVAVVGAWAGRVEPAEAVRRRPRAASLAKTPPGAADEAAWLDGVLAYVENDAADLEEAAEELRAGDGPAAGVLARSLDAFREAMQSDRGRAARELVALEEEGASRALHWRIGASHPFLGGVQRLSAARWLLESGDTTTVRRILRWYEVVLPGSLYPVVLANQVLATPALRVRAALARAAGGDTEAAAFANRLAERLSGPTGTAGGPAGPP